MIEIFSTCAINLNLIRYTIKAIERQTFTTIGYCVCCVDGFSLKSCLLESKISKIFLGKAFDTNYHYEIIHNHTYFL